MSQELIPEKQAQDEPNEESTDEQQADEEETKQDPNEKQSSDSELSHKSNKTRSYESDSENQKSPQPEIDSENQKSPQPEIDPESQKTPQPGIDSENRKPSQPEIDSENQETPQPKQDPKLRIFLIEFILEEFNMSYCTEFMHRCYRGPNCLSFKVLQQQPLVICHNSPVLKDCSETKTGASLMFTMNAEEVMRARKEFIIHIEAYRSIPDEEIPLGSGQLDLTNVMKCICAKYDAEEIRQEIEKEEMKRRGNYIPKPPVDMFTDTLRDVPVLQAPTDSVCDTAATVGLNIRLTCFGKLVQTNCQLVPTTEFPPYVECNQRK